MGVNVSRRTVVRLLEDSNVAKSRWPSNERREQALILANANLSESHVREASLRRVRPGVREDTQHQLATNERRNDESMGFAPAAGHWSITASVDKDDANSCVVPKLLLCTKTAGPSVADPSQSRQASHLAAH